jgi:hypothetical protein
MCMRAVAVPIFYDVRQRRSLLALLGKPVDVGAIFEKNSSQVMTTLLHGIRKRCPRQELAIVRTGEVVELEAISTAQAFF